MNKDFENGGFKRGTIAIMGSGVRPSRGASMLRQAMAIQAMDAIVKAGQKKEYPFGDMAEKILNLVAVDNGLTDSQTKRRLIEALKEVESAGYNSGLEEAAKYLEGTAADFDQTSNRLLRNNRTATNHERKEQQSCEEKAKLLKGQAGHIVGLKRP
jgi:phage regulator Rha-like protein